MVKFYFLMIATDTIASKKRRINFVSATARCVSDVLRDFIAICTQSINVKQFGT